MKPTNAKRITVVVCGQCGARFTTPAPPEFIERVRRCVECGERALTIDYTTSLGVAPGDLGRDGERAPSG